MICKHSLPFGKAEIQETKAHSAKMAAMIEAALQTIKQVETKQKLNEYF